MTELRKYQFTLITIAPVHIGDGDYYNQKEYIFEDGYYYFPDMGKVYQAIEKRGEQAVSLFEEFLLQQSNNYRKFRLVNILNELGVRERNFEGYKIKATGFERDRETRGDSGLINNVDSFMKNQFNEPYIPGSSLKGAIRTILVNEYFKKDNVIKGQNRNPQAIPWGAGRKNERPDDIFHNIRVSDSEPLKLDDLIIAQKLDYSVRKDKINPIPLYRESLKPLTSVRFTITCEGKLANELIGNLSEYANNHYDHYKKHFLNELKRNYRQPDFKNTIYIGAGSGIWTKTFIDEANTDHLTDKRRNRRTTMEGKGVYKLTKAIKDEIKLKSGSRQILNNKANLYEMGKCFFLIKELK